MDIQKNENSKRLIAVLVCLLCGLVLGSDYEAINILKGSYQISAKDEIASEIEKLQNAYRICDDHRLKDRIQYRIAMMYYKSDNLKDACELFEKISADTRYSKEIQFVATNMAAQIAKMQGRDEPALEYYDRLIKKIIKIINDSSNEISIRIVEKIYISSVLSKAEILTFQNKYSQASDEYKKAIEQLSNGSFKCFSKYLPVLYDRLSQLNLKNDNVKGYQNYTSMIADEYPDYERAALIKLESFAVKFFETKKIKQQYVNGSLETPVQLILYVKENTGSQDTARIESVFEKLCDQEIKGTVRWLMKYHYAWFLDAIGKKSSSLKLFNEIVTGMDADAAAKGGYVMEMILSYSKLQKALMEGECGRYAKGIKCIGLIENKNKDLHINSLAESIRNSLETLKREVIQDEN